VTSYHGNLHNDVPRRDDLQLARTARMSSSTADVSARSRVNRRERSSIRSVLHAKRADRPPSSINRHGRRASARDPPGDPRVMLQQMDRRCSDAASSGELSETGNAARSSELSRRRDSRRRVITGRKTLLPSPPLPRARRRRAYSPPLFGGYSARRSHAAAAGCKGALDRMNLESVHPLT